MKKLLSQDLENTDFLLSYYKDVIDRQRMWHIRHNSFKLEKCICNEPACFSKTRFVYTYCSEVCSKIGFANKRKDKAISKSSIILTEKICNRCKIKKPISEFHLNGKSKITGNDNIRSFCKECCDIKSKESYVKFREQRIAKQRIYNINNPGYYLNSVYIRKYGITELEYNKMFDDQHGKCFICKTHQSDLKKRLAVDHNHKTGKIRKLLCSRCNSSLGHVNEDILILENMINYLKNEL